MAINGYPERGLDMFGPASFLAGGMQKGGPPPKLPYPIMQYSNGPGGSEDWSEFEAKRARRVAQPALQTGGRYLPAQGDPRWRGCGHLRPRSRRPAAARQFGGERDPPRHQLRSLPGRLRYRVRQEI